MKNILALLILGTTTLFAQVPQGFNYQAALRDAAGAVLSSQPVSVKIELLQGAVTYTEVHNLTTNAVGLINLTVGYTPQSGGTAFSDINWNAGGVSMTTSYDPAGGTNWTLVGTSILQSVPFALSAANGFSGDFNDLTNVPSIDTSSVNELQSLSATGDTIKLSQGGSVYFQRFSGVFSDLTGVPTIDTSNTNEIQNLSRNGDTLRLSNGGAVVLPLSTKAEKIDDLMDGRAIGTSIGLGNNSLSNLTSANSINNVAIGEKALEALQSGSDNTAIGVWSMENANNTNWNTALGYGTLQQNTGWSNTAVGHISMNSNTSGYQNTAIGKEAMFKNTTGFSNVAVGYKSMQMNKTGIQNTAVGRITLEYNRTSSNNTAIGEGALHLLEIDSVVSNNNTALGNAAFYRLREGQNNIAIGSGVGAYLQKGSDNILIGGVTQGPEKTLPVWNNVAIGSGSGNHLDSNSYQNVLVGGNTGYMLRNGFANTALGFAAMQMMTKGHYNVAVGIQAMQMSNVQTSSNTAVGAQSLVNVKSSENTAIGKGSQNQSTTGGGNTSVGASSLNSNTTGSHNVAMGVNSLYNNTTGFSNTSIGTYSLNSNQTGQENVAVGFSAMSGNISGSLNTAVGLYTLYGYEGLSGNFNTALGANVLSNTKSGQGNTGLGYWVFPNLKAGSYNIGIGNNVGSNVRGANENILIGHDANVKDSMVTNSVAIGYQAVAKSSNAVQLGNSSTTTVSTNGRFEGKGGSLRDSSTLGDNAILRLSSNTKGLLLPRMTQLERDAISNPEEGLIVWCLNCGLNGQLSAFDGVSWVNANMPSVSGSLPNVSTDPVSSFGLTSATFGGNVLASGTGSILARGVCYSTSANPNITSSLTQQTTGSGAYNEFVTNLQSNTTYYLRAFATNSLGTSYGNQVVFKTKKVNVVGDTLGGGIIAYILAPGDQGYVMGEQHGLIALPWDYFNNTLTWSSCSSISSIVTATFIGSGALNTALAFNACSTSTTSGVIQVASNSTENGQSDWFVPSQDELVRLLQSNIFSQLALSPSTYYWSSSRSASNTGIEIYRRTSAGGNSVTGYSQSFNANGTNARLRLVRYF
jgi:hypothetical protein